MRPKRIILLRHGESEANVDALVYSHTPDHLIHLTDAGRAQARKAGAEVAELIGSESFGVYASPYVRTLETKDELVSVIPQRPVFDYQDPSLREQEYGNLPTPEASVANRELRERCGSFFYRFPDGESCADVYDRICSFLESLFRQFERPDSPENIIIVSHGTAIRCFLMRWHHWTVEQFETLPNMGNCEMVVINVHKGAGVNARKGQKMLSVCPASSSSQIVL